MAKIQGEGDYESARRYNSETRKYVKSKGGAASRAPGGGVDQAALRKARSKARDGGAGYGIKSRRVGSGVASGAGGSTQDARDAQLMTKSERSRRKTAARRGAH